jgi:hypothetical protein
MDPRLGGQYPPTEASRLISIAVACVAQDDMLRPGMADVLLELENLTRAGPGPGVSAPDAEAPGPAGENPDWFVPTSEGANKSSASSNATGASNLSHSSWSQQSGSLRGDQMSIPYQMSILQEGR